MSTRTEKVASVIRHAVNDVIARGLGDPRIRGLISVTRVEVSDDLAEARVYVSVLPQKHEELTMHGLHDAAGHIQHAIGPSVTARRLPKLRFVKDDSLKKQALLDAALRAGRPDDVEPIAPVEVDEEESEASESSRKTSEGSHT